MLTYSLPVPYILRRLLAPLPLLLAELLLGFSRMMIWGSASGTGPKSSLDEQEEEISKANTRELSFRLGVRRGEGIG